jgi:hypothetical protein
MAIATQSEPSMASLVSGIVSDTQTLIKQEVALARREVKDEIHKAVQAGVSLSIGIGCIAAGGLLLLFMLAHLVNWVLGFEMDRVFAGFGIIGGLALVIGIGLLLYARSRAEDIHVVPPQTAETMKETAQWIKNQT